MCHFREIKMCHLWEIEISHFWDIKMCHFWETKILFWIKIQIQFSGDWNLYLEIMFWEFLFITLLEFCSKNYSKSYSNYYHYFSIIIIIIIIILLTLFRTRRGQERHPFGFLLVIFFSVRATTSNFSEFSFYALRRFLANFQGYIASSVQKLFKTAWKKCQKRPRKNKIC